MHLMPREGTETNIPAGSYNNGAMHLMPREGTETCRFQRVRVCDHEMHLMPREGTETCRLQRVRVCDHEMHLMPRERTETLFHSSFHSKLSMHLMPREGTETHKGVGLWIAGQKCILCPVRGRKHAFDKNMSSILK